MVLRGRHGQYNEHKHTKTNTTHTWNPKSSSLSASSSTSTSRSSRLTEGELRRWSNMRPGVQIWGVGEWVGEWGGEWVIDKF